MAVHWLMTVLALVAVSVVWCFMALALFVMSVFGAVLVVISMLLSGVMDIVMLNTMTSALLDVMIELVELVFNIVLESLSVMEVNIVAISITLVRSV